MLFILQQWTKETREAESATKVGLQSEIKDIETYNWKLNVYKELMDARRETAAAALEVTYREWAQNAYQEVILALCLSSFGTRP